jgi:predicted NAD/FAD-binding protein
LQAIRYDEGELVVHKDTRLMPKEREDWTAINYMMSQDFKESMFTVWVNPVEPSIREAQPIFQTWNPVLPIEPKHVLSRVSLQRAVVHPGTAKALQTLAQLHAEKDRKVFFAGSWAFPGVPLLESAVRSAYAVLPYQ